MLNKLKKIKAFTILELTIVIVIIGVLMAATMKFGWDRIGLLNNKNIQEQFLDGYSSLQSRNNMTNYYMSKIYQDMQINFELEKDHFDYQYNSYDFVFNGRTYVEWWNYHINKLSLDGEDVSAAKVVMRPYKLWCDIEDGQKSLEIGLLVNNSRQYCFKIDSDVCRIRKISCN
jgi:prepilin-type N-terminal cleavage/methylation domain-containing protein